MVSIASIRRKKGRTIERKMCIGCPREFNSIVLLWLNFPIDWMRTSFLYRSWIEVLFFFDSKLPQNISIVVAMKERERERDTKGISSLFYKIRLEQFKKTNLGQNLNFIERILDVSILID